MWGWRCQGLCVGLGVPSTWGGGLGPSPGLWRAVCTFVPVRGPCQAHSYTLGAGERFGRQPSSRAQLTQPFLASPKLSAVK